MTDRLDASPKLELPWLLWALVGTLVAVSINHWVLDDIPHVQDEVVYQFQSRLLSEFRLWEDERLPRAAYPYEFIVNQDGRRYGVFPMGWPLVLSIGTLFGVPWLINPLLHGLTVFLGAWLSARLGGRRLAIFVAPLLALNPGLVIMASGRMSHTLCALLALAAFGCCLHASRWRALGLGAALGGLILARPFDGLLATVVFLPWAWGRSREQTWLWVLPGLSIGVALVLAQNALLEGSWSTFPQNAYFARGIAPFPQSSGWRFSADCNALGFGDSRGCFATAGSLGHSVMKGWLNTWTNLRSASALWLGTPMLLVVAVPIFVEKRVRLLGWVAGSLFAVFVIGHAFYWYHGTCYGPRFYHPVLPMVILVLGVGVEWAASRWRHGVAVLGIAMAIFCVRTWMTLPELEGYWGVDDRIATLERDWTGPPSLILVGASTPVSVVVDVEVTSSEQQHRAPFLRRGMWIEHSSERLQFAEFQPELVDEMARRFPDRPIHVLGLSADGSNDRLLPIADVAYRPPQVRDVPLPTAVPVFQFPPLQ